MKRNINYFSLLKANSCKTINLQRYTNIHKHPKKTILICKITEMGSNNLPIKRQTCMFTQQTLLDNYKCVK